MKKNWNITVYLAVFLVVLLAAACNQPFGQVLSNRSLLSFTFTSAANTGLSVDITGTLGPGTVDCTVPAGTVVTDLVPSFVFLGQEVRAGTEVQTSGVTARDFSLPVEYTVIAWSGEETVYTVTVTADGPDIPSDPWARTLAGMPGTDYSGFYGTAVDADGNVFAVGAQSEGAGIPGAYDYGDGVTLDGPDYFTNAVIVAYSADGNALWGRTIHSASDNSVFTAAAVDADGNVYAAGYQTGTGAFDYGDSVIATSDIGAVNAVCVKYDTDGNVLWARTVNGGSADSRFSGLAVDADGNVYAAGYQEDVDTYNYGGSASATGESSNINVVLVKYDSSGNGLWASTTFSGTNGSSESRFEGVAVDDGGSVYAAGYQYLPGGAPDDFFYSATLECPGVTAKNTGMLVCYSGSTGEAQWATSVISTDTQNNCYFRGIAAGDGSVYVAGEFYLDSAYDFEFDFGDGVTVPDGTLRDDSQYAVLVKYNSAGTTQWVTHPTVTSTSFSVFYGVAACPDGTVHAAGSQNYNTVYTYGTGVTASGGAESLGNAVLVSYDADGTALDALSVATDASGNSEFLTAAADAAGNVYAAGNLFESYAYTFSTFTGDVSATGVNTGAGPNIIMVKYGSRY